MARSSPPRAVTGVAFIAFVALTFVPIAVDAVIIDCECPTGSVACGVSNLVKNDGNPCGVAVDGNGKLDGVNIILPADTQATSLDLTGVKTLTGYLWMSTTTVTTLTTPDLITAASINIRENTALTALSFPELTGFAGTGGYTASGEETFELEVLSTSTQLASATFPKLTTAAGVKCEAPGAIQCDLSAMTHTTGDLQVRNANLAALKNVSGNMYFNEHDGATVAAEELTYVTGDLTLMLSKDATSVTLTKLNKVDGKIHVDEYSQGGANTALTALSFPALTEVGGKFRVESLDGLVTVRCDELVKIGGALELRLLPKLKSAYFQKVSIFILPYYFYFSVWAMGLTSCFFCVQVTQVASVSIGGDGKDADVYVPCVADGLLGLTTDKGSNNVNMVSTDKVTWKYPDGCSHAPTASESPSSPNPPKKSGAGALHAHLLAFVAPLLALVL